MAETTANINLDVQGAESLKQLAQAFDDLRTSAQAYQRSLRTAAVVPQAANQATTLGNTVTRAAAGIVGDSVLGAPMNVVSSAARVAGNSLLGFVGPLGRMGVTATASAPTLVAAGVAAVTILPFMIKLGITYRLVRSSWGWAQEAADRQYRIAYRTRRTFPGIVGDAFAPALEYTKTKMGIAAALFGEAAESLEDQITRRFTTYRLGRGLRGERDIFSRWGITPQFVTNLEKMKGAQLGVEGPVRLDLTDWLTIFIKKREELDARIGQAQAGSALRAELVRRKTVLLDDSLKLFNQQFADLAGVMTSEDREKLERNIAAAGLLYTPTQEHLHNAINFNIALETSRTSFKALKDGIAADVQPALTGMLTDLNNWLLPVEAGGRGMAEHLQRLAGAISTKAWETLEGLIRKVDAKSIDQLIQQVQAWDPASAIKTMQAFVPVAQTFATVVTGIIKFIVFFLPEPAGPYDWIPGVTAYKQGRKFSKALVDTLLGPEEKAAAVAPAGPAAPGAPAARTSWAPSVDWKTGAVTFGGAAPGSGSSGEYLGGNRSAGYTGPTADVPAGTGSLAATAPRTYARRKGEAGEFAAAKTGEFGAPGAANQTTITLKNGQKLTVNKNVAGRFEGFLNEAIDRGYPVNVSGGGGYNYRTVRGGSSLSQHSWGTAVDINVKQNAFKGTTTDMPEEIEAVAWKHGLSWGARFGDPMHFEAMSASAWESKRKQLAESGALEPQARAQAAAAAVPTAGATEEGGARLTGGRVSPSNLKSRLTNLISSSALAGYKPRDAEAYGMKTGSASEWADLMTQLAGKESSYKSTAAYTTAEERKISAGHGSHGLFQLSPNDAVNYGLQDKPFTMAQLQDPDINAQAAVAIAAKRVERSGTIGGQGMGKYWGPIKRGWRPQVTEEPTQVATAAPAPTIATTPIKAQVPITPEGGRATRVIEKQGQVAATRRLPIQPKLKAQLDYAAQQAGVVVEVTSGGQAAKGTGGPRTGSTRHDIGGAADITLRDSATGQLLDMRKPEDASRMALFTEASVRAGATGVGAGLGYMGAHTLHVGGGKTATWGGAEWIKGAHARGLATRGRDTAALADMPPPSTSDIELIKTSQADRAREDLTKPAPRRRDREIREGTVAGEAAAKAFKEGVKDVSIPVKSLTEEEKQRDKTADEKEKESAKAAA